MAGTKFTRDSPYRDPIAKAWVAERQQQYAKLLRTQLAKMAYDDGVGNTTDLKRLSKAQIVERLAHTDFALVHVYQPALRRSDPTFQRRQAVVESQREPHKVRWQWQAAGRNLLKMPVGNQLLQALAQMEWQRVPEDYRTSESWTEPPSFWQIEGINPRRALRATAQTLLSEPGGGLIDYAVLGAEYWADGNAARYFFLEGDDSVTPIALELWRGARLEDMPYADGPDAERFDRRPVQRVVDGGLDMKPGPALTI